MPQTQTEKFNSSLNPWFSDSIALAIISTLFGLLSVFCKAPWPKAKAQLTAMWIGLGLFVLPVVLVRLAAGQTSAYARTLAFSLTPIFTIALEPHIGSYQDRPIKNAWIASLLCTMGALFIFPVDIPGNIGSGVAFGMLAVAALSIAFASCLAYRLSREQLNGAEVLLRPLLPLGVTIAGVAAAGIMLAGVLEATVLSQLRSRSIPDLRLILSFESIPDLTATIRTALLKVPGLLLLLCLLPLMRPSRASVRYILAPVITILVGVILLRATGGSATLQLRSWLGLLTMACSAVYLLIAPALRTDDQFPSLGLKGNN